MAMKSEFPAVTTTLDACAFAPVEPVWINFKKIAFIHTSAQGKKNTFLLRGTLCQPLWHTVGWPKYRVDYKARDLLHCKDANAFMLFIRFMTKAHGPFHNCKHILMVQASCKRTHSNSCHCKPPRIPQDSETDGM